MKLIIPVTAMLKERHGTVRFSGLLQARLHVNEDGSIAHKPYYVLPLSLDSYDIEPVYNEDGNIIHFEFTGDEESVEDIKVWFGL